MRHAQRFTLGLGMAVLVGLGIWFGGRQQAEIRQARAALELLVASPASGSEAAGPTSRRQVNSASGPSVELLRRRAEVTRLRAELDSLAPKAQAVARAADEWAEVWQGVRPSEQPGFVRLADLQARGFATPTDALASFEYGMRHQSEAPLTPARMKDLYDVPDDYDDPGVRYSIHLGAGMGGEIGYRIIRQEPLDAQQVRLVLELENEDGSSFRQERILVQRDGRWRVKPEALERLGDEPPAGVAQ